MTFVLPEAVDERTAVQIANLARRGFAVEVIARLLAHPTTTISETLLILQAGGIPLPLAPHMLDEAEMSAQLEEARAFLRALRGPYALTAVPDDELMTITDVGLLKRVPQNVVDAAYRAGTLPAVIDPEIQYRFWRADVDRWQPPEQEREPIVGEPGIILALVRRGYAPVAIAAALGYQRNPRPILLVLEQLARRAVPVPRLGSYGTTELTRETQEIAALLPDLFAQIPEEWYPYATPSASAMTVLTPDQIRSAHASLVRGARWRDIQPALNISRQRFDMRRRELGLPPPREARKEVIATEHDLLIAPTEMTVRARREAAGWSTLGNAAASLGIRSETLAAQVRRGQIPHESEMGRTWVRLSDVEQYRATHRRQKGAVPPDGYHPTSWYEKQYGVTKAILYEERRKGKLVMERWGSSWMIHEDAFTRWFQPRAARKEQRANTEEIRAAYTEMEHGKPWASITLSARISWTTFVRRVKQMDIVPFWETISDDDIRAAHAEIVGGRLYSELPRFICMAYSTFVHRAARLGLPPPPEWEVPSDDAVRAAHARLAAGASWHEVGLRFPAERFMQRVMALGLPFDAVQEQIMVALGSHAAEGRHAVAGT